jgi:curved DNA-binding protein CbpA
VAQTETNAHALLGIGTEYDLRALARAYRKAALKYHPDRVRKHAAHLTAAQQAEANGMFARVTKAYLLLMDTFQRRQQDQPFDELRQASRAAGGVDGATGTTETVPTRPRVRLMKGDKFDTHLFNRIYDENRLGDVYDDGHGGWLTAEIPAEQQTETLFSGKFNKRVFNATFDQLKRADPNAQRQLVKRAEPEALVLSGSASSVDFGGSSGGLEYSDLKEAHTTNATLLDASRAEAETETFRDARVGAADAVAVAVGARGSCVAICDSWRINGVSGSSEARSIVGGLVGVGKQHPRAPPALDRPGHHALQCQVRSRTLPDAVFRTLYHRAKPEEVGSPMYDGALLKNVD